MMSNSHPAGGYGLTTIPASSTYSNGTGGKQISGVRVRNSEWHRLNALKSTAPAIRWGSIHFDNALLRRNLARAAEFLLADGYYQLSVGRPPRQSLPADPLWM